MKELPNIFAKLSGSNGAHCGLTDFYPEHEAALQKALKKRKPFEGWYSSKKEIASARIWSEDGVKIKVEVSVSDDFDTIGLGYQSTKEWTFDAVVQSINKAWSEADSDKQANEPYVGFSIYEGRQCLDYYLLSNGEYDTPPGDYYHWWGWQHDADTDLDGVESGVPDPTIPLPVVAAFENWAQRWAYGQTDAKGLTIGKWSIKPWGEKPPAVDDPSDYVGMGWVGCDGRP